MDWSELNMDRLYELYRQYFHQLRKDVVQVNSSLGSTRPEKTWMDELTDIEFKTLVSAPTEDPGVVRRWVKCIIRGHEHEFPELRVA